MNSKTLINTTYKIVVFLGDRAASLSFPKLAHCVGSKTMNRILLLWACISIPLLLIGIPNAVCAESDTRAVALLEELKDPRRSDEVKKELGEICKHSQSASKLLIRTLDSEYHKLKTGSSKEQYVRDLLYAVGDLDAGAADALPLLCEIMKDPTQQEDLGYWSAFILGLLPIPSESVDDALFDTFQHTKSASLRETSGVSLGRRGVKRAIPLFLQAMKEHGPKGDYVSARALGCFSEATLNEFAPAKFSADGVLKPKFSRLSPLDAKKVSFEIQFRTFIEVYGVKTAVDLEKYVAEKSSLKFVTNADKRTKPSTLAIPNGDPSPNLNFFVLGDYWSLDANGLDCRGQRLQWEDDNHPMLNEPGEHTLKVAGVLHEKKNTQIIIPFETNEMHYIVDSQYASFAALEDMTRKSLEQQIGAAAQSLKFDISEDADWNKCVKVHLGKELYPREKLPASKRYYGRYFGVIYEYRYSTEGEFRSYSFSPSFMIID